MKRKTSLLFVAMAFLFFASSGQAVKYIYYFDAHLNICPQSESVYTGLGSMENNLVKLDVTNNVSKQLLLMAHFSDSSLSLNQGLLQSFFPNGIKETEGNYEKGIQDGLWENWDTTGHLTDSIIYDNGKKTDSAKFYYYKNGVLQSYDFTDFKNDKFHEIFYNDSGKIISETSFIGQKGITKYYKDNGEEIDTVFTKKEIEASFPGGAYAWTKYISREIMKNLDLLYDNGSTGTCIVKFTVDKDGSISNVEATTMQGSLLARIAINAIIKGPKWIPAKQYGKPVKAFRLQPVTVAKPQ